MATRQNGSGQERVLVVDDQEPVARTVARWLEREGMRCDMAHSAHGALERVEETEYGMFFVDVHLPGESGLDLARDLKRRDPRAQVIIITGSTTVDTAIQALRLGADDYLPKPFDAPALLHAAKRAAEHRRLLLENQEYRLNLEARVKEQGRRLEGLYLSSVHSLVAALEAKDAHTRGHSDRVAEYAGALLAELGGGVDSDALRTGAQLHDIGKIGVTSRILHKEGPLDSGELDDMQRHPTIGVQILAPLLEGTALDVVHYHHERWDGAGYPAGLAGRHIPLAARIVAVADTFDAMTTSRPYRGALSAEQAVAEIESEAGRQFDPDVARVASQVFLGALRRVS